MVRYHLSVQSGYRKVTFRLYRINQRASSDTELAPLKCTKQALLSSWRVQFAILAEYAFAEQQPPLRARGCNAGNTATRAAVP